MGNKRRRRRSGKGRFGFIYTLLVMLVLLLVFSLSVGLFFKTTKIEVIGTVKYTSAEIVEATGFVVGDNIFFINKLNAIKNIFEKMPFIEKVQIRRKLPGTIVVDITEEYTYGVIEHQGYYWMFNSRGKLLGSKAALPGIEYPVVKGVSLVQPAAGQEMAFSQEEIDKRTAILEIFRILHELGLHGGVKSLDISNMSNVRFQYLDNFDVLIGMPTDLEYKLTFLKESVEQADKLVNWEVDLSTASDKRIRFIPKN